MTSRPFSSRPVTEWKELFDTRMGRESGVWSKKEVVLPELRPESIVSLGEGNSPLIRSEALARQFGVAEVQSSSAARPTPDPSRIWA